MPTLPAFSKRGKPTNYNLINFFLYAFWRARKIVFIYWFLLDFVNSSFFSFLFFGWIVFVNSFGSSSSSAIIWEREKEKRSGGQRLSMLGAECRYALGVFWLWWLSWTVMDSQVFHHSWKRFSRNLLHTSFFFFLTRWDKKPPLYSLYCK